MSSLAHFAAMGGYAAFVWPAYAASMLVLGLVAWRVVAGVRRNEAALAQAEIAESAPAFRPRVTVTRAAQPARDSAAAGQQEGRP